LADCGDSIRGGQKVWGVWFSRFRLMKMKRNPSYELTAPENKKQLVNVASCESSAEKRKLLSNPSENENDCHL
jgi:hypothetical protein